MKQLRIGVENSTWNNIGDGFYQSAIQHIVSVVCPGQHVAVIDGPAVRGFRSNRFAGNVLDGRGVSDIDVAILSGPILNRQFARDYGAFIRELREAGKAYIILSAHCDRRADVIREVRAAIVESPPVAISTRDTYTFEAFGDIAPFSYDGICAAFFVSKVPFVAQPKPTPKFIVLSTYTTFEPRFSFETDETGRIDLCSLAVTPRKLPLWRIMRHGEWLRVQRASYQGYKIVRVHQALYPFEHILFGAPNSYVSHNPLCYLPLYHGAELVVSDRVHACVAALSFGRPVYFFGQTARAELFERARVEIMASGVMHVSREALQREYRNFCDWLKSIPHIQP